jgi:hypothetical protein
MQNGAPAHRCRGDSFMQSACLRLLAPLSRLLDRHITGTAGTRTPWVPPRVTPWRTRDDQFANQANRRTSRGHPGTNSTADPIPFRNRRTSAAVRISARRARGDTALRMPRKYTNSRSVRKSGIRNTPDQRKLSPYPQTCNEPSRQWPRRSQTPTESSAALLSAESSRT